MDWKKKIVQALWLLAGVGTIVLFGAAMQQKNHKTCTDINVEIVGAEQHLFIVEQDVRDIINGEVGIKNIPMYKVDLRSIETALEKTPWVKNAELFFDNKQVLQVKIIERQPVARIFTVQGNSFYVDSAGLRLPLSEKLSAKVPMFTNFPSDKALLAAPDSLLLESVVELGKYIVADSFWMAQTAQIDITSKAIFELVPTIGDQIIVLGNADDLESKFSRLTVFYKNAWLQNGMNTYEKLDVQYNNQVVATRRGASKAVADSMKTKLLLEAMMQSNTSALADTANGLIPKNLAKVDSSKLPKPLAKPAIGTSTKKKLPLTALKNNKKKTNPLSIVNKPKPIKPKAVMNASSH